MRSLSRLVSDRSGSAAAEMAMSLPILLVLLFGSVELGNYFLSEHVVQKAVRDASRYAARLSMLPNYVGCAVDPAAEQKIQYVAKTGDPDGDYDDDGDEDQRLSGWTSRTMTTVSIACDNTSSYATGGIYTEFPNGAPVITVSATVPYNTLFGAMGLGPATLNLNAESQAAVIGA